MTYAALEIGLALSPGPAVFTIIAQGVRHGWRKSFFGNLGITSGNLLYFALSAVGVGAFIAASPALYGTLRWGGIAYLAYTAARMLLARPSTSKRIEVADGRPRALYVQALATQLSNPKTIVFFVSFLAPFLDPAASWPIPAQIAIYAATTAALETPILFAYGVAASHGSRMLPEGKVGVWQDRIAGGALLTAAAWLALRS